MKIGVAINTAVAPSRNFLLALERIGVERSTTRKPITARFFLGSPATSAENLAQFAAGIDILCFCGLSRKIVFRYLREHPRHPPVVFCAFSDLSEAEFALLRPGAVVMRDNPALGRRAADFFIERGLRNFAFLGRNGNYGEIVDSARERAFREQIENKLAGNFRYSSFSVGMFSENADYWEGDVGPANRWLRSLPLPCGIFVNDGHLAFSFLVGCRKLGIGVPDDLEILSVCHDESYCNSARPTISSIVPSSHAVAEKALDLALELFAHPSAGNGSRVEMIDVSRFQARASTSIRRGYGHVAVQAKEFIRNHASRGISVSDVAAALGIARRTLEFRVREATGSSVHALITDVRMATVCDLLKTTNLPIGEVLEAAGCPAASSIFAHFKKCFGMTMREYRRKFGNDGKRTERGKATEK